MIKILVRIAMLLLLAQNILSNRVCICSTNCSTFGEFLEFIRRVCTRHYYKSNTQKKVQEVGPRGKKKIVSKMSFSSAKSMSVTHLHLAAKLVALEGCKVYKY